MRTRTPFEIIQIYQVALTLFDTFYKYSNYSYNLMNIAIQQQVSYNSNYSEKSNFYTTTYRNAILTSVKPVR